MSRIRPRALDSPPGPHSPIGRGSGLKIRPVSVRVRLGARVKGLVDEGSWLADGRGKTFHRGVRRYRGGKPTELANSRSALKCWYLDCRRSSI